MKLAVIGCGYVGLVTGVCFAELGHQVIGVDNDPAKIDLLLQGKCPIYEPGLEPLLAAHLREERIRFTTDIREATRECEVIFICVGTPPMPDGSANLKAVEFVVSQIAEGMDSYRLIVEKSTVPVRTGRWLEELVRSKVKNVPFDIASNPEFLREGSALEDFLHPDRVVIGCNSEKAASLLVNLYTPLNAPVLVTDLASAELIKHASNSFLAMKISYINAVAQVCEKTGADINKVAVGLGLDKRIGMDFLKAGIGYGGTCFPKDLRAFVSIAEECGLDFGILREVDKVNENMWQSFVGKIENMLGGVSGKTIALLGLAFKPNTDDMRSAPSIPIAETLIQMGAKVRAYDPVAMENAKKVLPELEYFSGPYEAAQGADAVAILTEWQEFKAIDFSKLQIAMKGKVLADGRNMYSPERMRELGFVYSGIGRAETPSEQILVDA